MAMIILTILLVLIPSPIFAAFPTVMPTAIFLDKEHPEAELVIMNDETCPISYTIQFQPGADSQLAHNFRFAPRASKLAPGQTQVVRMQMMRSATTGTPQMGVSNMVIVKTATCGAQELEPQIRWAVSIPIAVSAFQEN